jgi:hypothetical protein
MTAVNTAARRLGAIQIFSVSQNLDLAHWGDWVWARSSQVAVEPVEDAGVSQ